MGILSNKIGRDKLKPGDHIYSWRHAYIYAHHGIYVGDGKVIHFTRGAGQEIGTGTVLDRIIFSSSPCHPANNPCPNCGDQSRLDGVISSCIDCFLKDGKDGNLYLFEYGVSPAFFLAKARGGTCTLAASDPPEDVLHRASFLLENGFGVYHVFKNNCEDFAIFCKTGLLAFTNTSVGRSGQAVTLSAAGSAFASLPLRFLTTCFSGSAVLGCGVAGCGMYCVFRYVSDIGIRRDVTKVSVERLVSCSSLEQLEIAANVANKLGVAANVANELEVAADVANKLQVAVTVANMLEVAANVANKLQVAATVANMLEVAATVANKLEVAADVPNKLQVAATVANMLEVAADVANKLQVAATVANMLEVAANVANKLQVAADVANMLEVAANVANKLQVAATVANMLEVAADVPNKLQVAASVANTLEVAANAAKLLADVANKLEVAADVAKKKKSNVILPTSISAD